MNDDIPIETIRARCIRGHEWPEALRSCVPKGSAELDFDRDRLLHLASQHRHSGFFYVSVLSREYLPLGIEWARRAQTAGLQRFAIGATDTETIDALDSLKIPCFRVALPPALAESAYRGPGGLDGKGTAILCHRLAIIKFLVDQQINATACDIDALLLRDPAPCLPQDADIAFQRVTYFPRPLAKFWGFTACCGFVAYRSSPRVSAFIDGVFARQREATSDQIALNLALLDDAVRWEIVREKIDDEDRRRDCFAAGAGLTIRGRTQTLNLSLAALPADLFWRHDFVRWDPATAVLLHPNSPQTCEGKVEVFRKLLGNDFNR